jgi:hypothetical protein
VQAAVPEDEPDPEPPAAAAEVAAEVGLATDAGVLDDDAAGVAEEPDAAGDDDELQPAASTPAVRNVTASGAPVARRPSGGRVM